MWREDFATVEKELKLLAILKTVITSNNSDWGSVHFNIEDYPEIKEWLNEKR